MAYLYLMLLDEYPIFYFYDYYKKQFKKQANF